MIPFPFLNLPHLAAIRVCDYWAPREILNFSSISSRTYHIVESINRKKATSLKISNYPFDRYLFIYISQRIYGFYEYPSMLDMLAVVEEAIRIFKVPFIDVTLTGTGETLAFFYWAVRRPYRVRNMKLRCFNRIHAENFFDLFIGRCEHLILQFEFERPFKLSREVRWPSKVSLDLHRNHFNLSKLINSPELCFINVHVTDKQLNAFIRSWQSGKRNQRLRRVYFQQWAVLNDVLSRIQVNHKDPLKVKRVFTLNNVTWSIDGGIDIAGPNGKTATIKWEPFREEGMPAETDEEAFRRIFRDYKFTRVTGSLGKLYVSSFTIFVW